MCSAPNSACARRRSAGLRKGKSSWHIHRLTKDADFGLWSKNALMCIAPMRKHLFGARFPSSPWGLTAIAFTTQAREQLRNVLLVPHSPSPLCLNERHGKEWRKKFLFPTFGLCQRASPLGRLRAQCVPTGKNEGSVVSPPSVKSVLAGVTAPREKWPLWVTSGLPFGTIRCSQDSSSEQKTWLAVTWQAAGLQHHWGWGVPFFRGGVSSSTQCKGTFYLWMVSFFGWVQSQLEK